MVVREAIAASVVDTCPPSPMAKWSIGEVGQNKFAGGSLSGSERGRNSASHTTAAEPARTPNLPNWQSVPRRESSAPGQNRGPATTTGKRPMAGSAPARTLLLFSSGSDSRPTTAHLPLGVGRTYLSIRCLKVRDGWIAR